MFAFPFKIDLFPITLVSLGVSDTFAIRISLISLSAEESSISSLTENAFSRTITGRYAETAFLRIQIPYFSLSAILAHSSKFFSSNALTLTSTLALTDTFLGFISRISSARRTTCACIFDSGVISAASIT